MAAGVVRFSRDAVRGAVPFAVAQTAMLLHMVEQGRQPVAHFHDVGCGDGFLSAAMLGAYPRARGVLVDFSPPMLEAARERMAAAPTTPVFVAADLAAPAWLKRARDHGPFDAIRHHEQSRPSARSRDDIAAAYANRPDRAANRLAPPALQCDWLREAGFVGVAAPFRWYELAVFGGYRPR